MRPDSLPQKTTTQEETMNPKPFTRPPSRRCSHRTRSGRPCRAWAIRGSDPPLCSIHAGRNLGGGAPPGNQNARTHGFYATTFTTQEVAELLAQAGAVSLEAEIACARIALHRVLRQLAAAGPEPPSQDYVKLVALAFQGARTVARLLRDNQAIAGAPPGELAAVLDRALEELSDEWDINLADRHPAGPIDS
jgi:hypothetical protein